MRNTPFATTFRLQSYFFAFGEWHKASHIILYLHIQNKVCNFLVNCDVSRASQWSTLSFQILLTKSVVQNAIALHWHNLFAFLRWLRVSQVIKVELGQPTPAFWMCRAPAFCVLMHPLPGAVALGEELGCGMCLGVHDPIFPSHLGDPCRVLDLTSLSISFI